MTSLDGMVAGNFVSARPSHRHPNRNCDTCYTVAGLVDVEGKVRLVLAEFAEVSFDPADFVATPWPLHLMFRRWLNRNWPIEGPEITIEGKVH